MRRSVLVAVLVSAFSVSSPLSHPAWAESAGGSAAPSSATTANLQVGQIVPLADIPAIRNIVPADTVARFLGDDYGINAYFIVQQQKGKVVYVTPDRQGVLDGSLFGGDGTSATLQQLTRLRESGFDPIPFIAATMMAGAQQQQTAAAVTSAATSQAGAPSSAPESTGSTSGATPASPTAPAQALSTGEQFLQEVSAASWIAFGQPSAPMLSVVMDPLCEHCHTYFKTIYPYVQQGKVYLRVLPVSVLDVQKGQALLVNVLSSASPAEAWTALVNGKTATPPAAVNPRAEAAIKANNAFFARWTLPGTPYAVYREKASGKVKLMFSAPKDMTAFLSELGVTP